MAHRGDTKPLCHVAQMIIALSRVSLWPFSGSKSLVLCQARGFAVAPTTVWPWRGEAAEQLRAFAALCRGDLHLEQRPLDAWYAVLRARKAGEISDAEAITRLERASSWGWTAMAPGAHCWSCSMWAVAC
jgi:hypothetical protein